jgi:hypothetical protein
VIVCDVEPRDGLQNEDRVLEPALRAELCDKLATAGLKRIEAASFVNPKLVPQMAGAEDVMAALHRRPGTSYAGLVLNEKGYDRAIAAGVDEVHYAFAATDEFGRRNQNATTSGWGCRRAKVDPPGADGLAPPHGSYLVRASPDHRLQPVSPQRRGVRSTPETVP